MPTLVQQKASGGIVSPADATFRVTLDAVPQQKNLLIAYINSNAMGTVTSRPWGTTAPDKVQSDSTARGELVSIIAGAAEPQTVSITYTNTTGNGDIMVQEWAPDPGYQWDATRLDVSNTAAAGANALSLSSAATNGATPATTTNNEVVAIIVACNGVNGTGSSDAGYTIVATSRGTSAYKTFATPTVPDTIISWTTSRRAALVLQAYKQVAVTGGSAQTVSPTSIPSGEAVGSAVLASVVTASGTGIASAEAVGVPNISARVTAIPNGVSSAEALGNPVLSTKVTVSPTGVGTSEAVGTPVIGQPAAGGQTVVPNGVTTSEAVGTPVITPKVTISPTGIATLEGLGNPTVLGKVTVSPTGIASGEALGTPVIATTGAPQGVSPTGIASAQALGVPSVLPQTTVVGLGIASAEAVGMPVLRTVTLIVPTGIESAEAVGTPVLYRKYKAAWKPTARMLSKDGYAKKYGVGGYAVMITGGGTASL